MDLVSSDSPFWEPRRQPDIAIRGRGRDPGASTTLLARLQRFWASQRQFVSKVSRELRSPVTRMHKQAKIAVTDSDATVESLEAGASANSLRCTRTTRARRASPSNSQWG
jgi:hypothetical protein